MGGAGFFTRTGSGAYALNTPIANTLLTTTPDLNFAALTAAPLVRVPWNEPGIIGRVLDVGALSVIIPMVNSAEDAVRAVAARRYAPAGARSFGPLTAMIRHGFRTWRRPTSRSPASR